MDRDKTLRNLLNRIQDGRLNVDQGLAALRDLPFLDIGHTKIDFHRSLRNGFPEVIFAEGKTPEQVADIFLRMKAHTHVLATRVPEKMARYVESVCPEVRYNALGRTLTLLQGELSYRKGEITIVTAGTSDLPVAEEARITCDILGSRARIISDVGVAGVHRLLHHVEEIRKSPVVIVAAGMEGALASVVGGLVDRPLIAVPTSVGYGANFAGLSALLGMLTSCAAGVSVVNIDNGFGAACAACRIHNLVDGELTEP